MTNGSVRPSDEHHPVECSATAAARALQGLYGMDTVDPEVQSEDLDFPAHVEAGEIGESPEEYLAKIKASPA